MARKKTRRFSTSQLRKAIRDRKEGAEFSYFSSRLDTSGTSDWRVTLDEDKTNLARYGYFRPYIHDMVDRLIELCGWKI